MLKVGVVGCGNIGSLHADCLAEISRLALEDVRLTAVYDADAERRDTMAAVHGAEASADLDALIAACDAVWICTWTAAHRDIVELAAERGLAIFCEKPLAPTLDDAERVAGLLAKVPHRIGLASRTLSTHRRTHQLLREGSYGRPMAVMLRDDQFFPVQGRYNSSWRNDVELAGGGTLLEHSIHDIDVFNWWLGTPDTVSAHTSFFAGTPGIEDVATVTLTYSGGAVATLVSVWHQIPSRGTSRRLEVFSEKALIWYEDARPDEINIVTDAGERVERCPLPTWTAAIEQPDAWRRTLVQYYSIQAREFIAFLNGGGKGACSPGAGEGILAHQVIDAAYESAALGGTVIPFRGTSAGPLP
ncbi:MAG: Gfo/Idh/MocA family protein [Candidatus Dormibacteria bacterium]